MTTTWDLHLRAVGNGGFILVVTSLDESGQSHEEVWVRESVERAIVDVTMRLRALILPPN